MTVHETIKTLYPQSIPLYEFIFTDYMKDKDTVCGNDFLMASALLLDCCRHGIKGVEEELNNTGVKDIESMLSKAVLMMSCKDFQEILSERFEDGMTKDEFLKLAHSVADEMMSDEFLGNKADEIIKTIKAG